MKVQTITIAIVVFAAAIAGVFSIPRSHRRHWNGYNFYDPDFQLDVLQQEKATPGKVFKVTDPNGSEVMKYVCAPDDAAIAIFTMRDKFRGQSLRAAVSTARDMVSRNYLGVVMSNGPVKVLALKRGFSTKPDAVNVEIANAGVTGRRRGTIRIEDIADPVRDVVPPPDTTTAEAEKSAFAKLNHDRTFVTVECRTPLPPDQVEKAVLVDSSYFPFILPRRPFGFWPLPNTSAVSIDAVKVRLDRFHKQSREVVLTYKDAKLVKVNGRNFVSLPKRQELGQIEGALIVASNKPPLEFGGHRLQSPPSNQVIELQWKFRRKRGERVDPTKAVPPPELELLSVSPKIDDLGLDTLRVSLNDAFMQGRRFSGFTEVLRSQQKSTHPLVIDIPKIEFRVRITHLQKISSRTLVLPVHK